MSTKLLTTLLAAGGLLTACDDGPQKNTPVVTNNPVKVATVTQQTAAEATAKAALATPENDVVTEVGLDKATLNREGGVLTLSGTVMKTTADTLHGYRYPVQAGQQVILTLDFKGEHGEAVPVIGRNAEVDYEEIVGQKDVKSKVKGTSRDTTIQQVVQEQGDITIVPANFGGKKETFIITPDRSSLPGGLVEMLGNLGNKEEAETHKRGARFEFELK